MTEKPILFSGPMVRAILEGRKTMTRRVVKPQPVLHCGHYRWQPDDRNDVCVEHMNAAMCPYGPIGRHLWVREKWACAVCEPQETKGIMYHATYKDDANWFVENETHLDEWYKLWSSYTDKWRPSIHMPRWASRITLEVTGVRVERVQEISESDAQAEGSDPWYEADLTPCGELRDGPSFKYTAGFHDLWNSINAESGFGWDVNPWVWVVEFKRINK